MKQTIEQIHHYEYIHLLCCHNYLYDILARVEFSDYLAIMKKYPMRRHFSFTQRIGFFFHRIHYFIFEIDLEIIREAFDSVRKTYEKLSELKAEESLLLDYTIILTRLQKLLIDNGHLD